MNGLTRQLVTMAAMIMLITSLSSRAAGRDAIRVRPEAQVARAAVCLADVAEITVGDEELSKRLEQMVVLTFTEDMAQADVGAFDINRALAQAGLQPATLDVFGARFCVVSREAVSPIEDAEEDSKQTEGRQPTEPPLETPAAPEGGGHVFGEGTLAAELEALIHKAAPCEENRLKVEWDEGDRAYLAQTGEANPWEIRPRGRVGLGEVCFEVRRNGADGKEPRRLVRGKVWCLQQVVAAQRVINAGETIGPDDVKVTIEPVTDLCAAGLEDVAAVVGQAARRTIRPQQPIAASDLMKVMLVRRNDMVEVGARIGSVMVQRQAKALADGGLGEIISVRDLDNRIVIQGRVTGRGVVTVADRPVATQKPNELRIAGRQAATLERVN